MILGQNRFLFTTERYRLFLAPVSVRSPETALGVLQNRGSTMQPAFKSTKLQFMVYNLPLNNVILTSERGPNAVLRFRATWMHFLISGGGFHLNTRSLFGSYQKNRKALAQYYSKTYLLQSWAKVQRSS
jgi:hypothetical protein